MNPPTLERQILVMLAAAAIPLGVGAAVQARQVLEQAAAQCEVEPVLVQDEDIVIPKVVSVPIAVPEVPEPPESEDESAPIPMPTTGDAPSLPPGAFAFVVTLDGPHLVLATDVPESWSQGQPRLETPGRVSAKLAKGSLPPEVEALVGKKVDVYDAEGKQGVAWVGWPRVVAQAEGEIGDGIDTFAAWDAFEDPLRSRREPSRIDGRLRAEVEENLELIEALWNEGRRIVVAPLDTDADGTWARLSSLPSPRVLTIEDLPADMVEETVPWAWQDPSVLDWSGGYDVYRTSIGDDERVDLSDIITGARWSDAQGVGMVTFTVTDPDGIGCDGYGRGVWGADDIASGRKRPAIAGEGPTAVFDLDGNGILDVLVPSDAGDSDTQLLLGTPEGFIVEQELPPVTFFGCPC
jgi:hypothetical protein